VLPAALPLYRSASWFPGSAGSHILALLPRWFCSVRLLPAFSAAAAYYRLRTAPAVLPRTVLPAVYTFLLRSFCTCSLPTLVSYHLQVLLPAYWISCRSAAVNTACLALDARVSAYTARSIVPFTYAAHCFSSTRFRRLAFFWILRTTAAVAPRAFYGLLGSARHERYTRRLRI